MAPKYRLTRAAQERQPCPGCTHPDGVHTLYGCSTKTDETPCECKLPGNVAVQAHRRTFAHKCKTHWGYRMDVEPPTDCELCWSLWNDFNAFRKV